MIMWMYSVNIDQHLILVGNTEYCGILLVSGHASVGFLCILALPVC